MRGEVVRRVKDGKITLHRGDVSDMGPETRRQLARLSLPKGGHNRTRIERNRTSGGLFAIYARNEDGEIVGWINWMKDGSVNQRSVYVRQRDRLRGVGTALIREALRYIQSSDRDAYFPVKDSPAFFRKVI